MYYDLEEDYRHNNYYNNYAHVFIQNTVKAESIKL